MTIANELLKVFVQIGIPREILTNKGTNFTSQVMREVWEILKAKVLSTSMYHLQMDGLVEIFNQTLKRMLKKFISQDP